MAFFVLLSFPPALLLVVWGLSSLLDDPDVRHDVVKAIIDALPLSNVDGRQEVERMLDQVAAGASGLGWLGALALLGSASAAVNELRRAVNEAWRTKEPRPFVQAKALDLGVTIVVAPLAVAALALKLANVVPATLCDRPALTGALNVLLTDLLPAAIVFGLLLGLYRILPASGATLRAAWPGALTGTVALILIQIGEEAWFSGPGEPNGVYGSIAALLVVVLSVYVNATAVVFGAHVAASAARLPDRAARDRAIEDEREHHVPFRRWLVAYLRGLVVRPPRESSKE